MTVAHDDLVASAAAHWLPRLLQNGIDYGDFVRTIARTADWSDWLPQWSRTADEHAARAHEAAAAGHSATAGQAWLQAAIARHFGKFVWTVDPERYAEATRLCAHEMTCALGYLDPSAEHLEFGFGPDLAHANLRKPAGVDRPPYVVLIPGLDSTKEEFHRLENAHLERGVATVSVDGPGQGETGLRTLLRPDYEVVVTALLDVLSVREDLDHRRIGAVGVSLGGYFAPRAAAFEPRITALVAISGPFCFGDVFDAAPQLTRNTIGFKLRTTDEDEARSGAMTFTLEGILANMSIPALYVTGDADRIVPWQQTARQADETPGAEFINYPGGSHALSNMSVSVRPALADWIGDQLRAVRP